MNLRRSVFRLLFVTAFLLLVAWVAMQLMQNGGNFDALLEKGQEVIGEKFNGLVQFFQEKLTPIFQGMTKNVQEFTGNMVPQ